LYVAFNTGYKRFGGGGGSRSSALNSFFDVSFGIMEVNGPVPFGALYGLPL
jgi:hypothetical protein